jgi:hypothetical protein
LADQRSQRLRLKTLAGILYALASLQIEIRLYPAREVGTRYHGESFPLQHAMELQAELLVRHIQGRDRYKTYVAALVSR